MSRSAATPHALGERRVDRRALGARLLPRARPARLLLGGAHGHAGLDDLAGEPAAAFLVGNRQDGARVALAQLAALDHREHVVGEVEQPHPVRDGRLRPADPLRDLAEREPELVDQERAGPRLLDRGELLAGDVLDEREQERVAVVRLAHERRHRRQAGLARGAPAPLAGDQLPAARRGGGGRRRAGSRPARGRSRPGRARPRRRGACAAGAGSGGSPRRGARRARSRLRRRSAPRGRGRGRGRPRPTAHPIRSARQAPSPPSSRPRRRRSGGRRRSRGARGSAPPRGAPSAARRS